MRVFYKQPAGTDDDAGAKGRGSADGQTAHCSQRPITGYGCGRYGMPCVRPCYRDRGAAK